MDCTATGVGSKKLDEVQPEGFHLITVCIGKKEEKLPTSWSNEILAFASYKPEEWNTLLTLLRLTKQARKRALKAFEERSVIHINNDFEQDSTLWLFAKLEIVKKCGSFLMKVQDTVTCSLYERHDVIVRKPSVLRATLSARMVRGSKELEPMTCLWDLHADYPTAFELRALRYWMNAIERDSRDTQELWNARGRDLSGVKAINQAWNDVSSLFDLTPWYTNRGVTTDFIKVDFDGKMVATDDEKMDEMEKKVAVNDRWKNYELEQPLTMFQLQWRWRKGSYTRWED